MSRWQTLTVLRNDNLAVEIKHKTTRKGLPWYSIRVGASPFEDDQAVLPYIPVKNEAPSNKTPQLDSTCADLADLLTEAHEYIAQHIRNHQ